MPLRCHNNGDVHLHLQGVSNRQDMFNENSLLCNNLFFRKLKKGRNRIHSQAHSTATLMSADKQFGKNNSVGPANMTIGNPISTLHSSGSVSSLNGAGGTSILAGSLDRDAQRERDNYTATVRSKTSLVDYP